MKKIILIFFVLIFSGCQTTQNVRNTQFSKGDLEIFPNHKWELPGGLDYQVSDKTLEYYYKRVTSRHKIRPREKYVILGGDVSVKDNIRIGEGSIVAGASKVFNSFPKASKIGGSPAQDINSWKRLIASQRLSNKKRKKN